MRILFVHERFGAMAGAEVNVYLGANELKRRGHTPGILYGSSPGKDEVAWREIFSERYSFGNGNGFVSAETAFQKFRPDVIYVHKTADLSVLHALVKSGFPLVRMVHDHDLYCMRSYKYHPLTRNICNRPFGLHCILPCGAPIQRNRDGNFPLKWTSYGKKKKELQLNRRFHRMIVATAYMREELLRNGFDSRRIEIHAPVPQNRAAAQQSSFSDRNLIIYAGQIIRGKGVDVLLQALARVRVPFECLIFGDGNHRVYCERLARRLKLHDRVHFKGYVPPAELEDNYAEASLAVVSSVWPEPFGAVGLEAMRYGLPVVAFDAGGIKEWLTDGETGFLVPWMNRIQFSERVEKLLREKTLARQLGARARRIAEERFNFERYIDGLEETFARVVAEVRQNVLPSKPTGM